MESVNNLGEGRAAAVVQLVSKHQEKLRYLVVGVWNTAFGYLLFLLLLATMGRLIRPLGQSESQLLSLLGANYYMVCNWTAWVFAVPQSTLTMKYLVFHKKGHPLKQIAKAYFVYIPSQVIGSVLLWFFVRVMGIAPWLGALLTLFVTTIFGYLGHKYFTFGSPSRAESYEDESPDESTVTSEVSQ